jgi:hypothetical protein
MLMFRDGDKRNFDLGNQELVSLKKTILRYTINNYGPELVQLTHLRGAITRQINQRSKT